MEYFTLSIAGFTIGIRFHKSRIGPLTEKSFRDRVLQRCEGFIIGRESKKVDYWINVIQHKSFEAMIQVHSKKHFVNLYEEGRDNSITTFYHISDAQFQLILRDVLQILLTKHKGMLFHASASLINDRAHVFLGKSGAGKSTIMWQLSLKYPCLAEDTIILKQEYGKFHFYQTPFIEKDTWIEKKMDRFELGKFFFLRKAAFYKIEKIKDKESILKSFSEQLFTDRGDVATQMKYVLELLSKHKEFYRLYFSFMNTNELVELINTVKNL